MKCKYCGSEHLEYYEGFGIHAAKLVCETCGRFQKWMSKAWVAENPDIVLKDEHFV